MASIDTDAVSVPLDGIVDTLVDFLSAKAAESAAKKVVRSTDPLVREMVPREVGAVGTLAGIPVVEWKRAKAADRVDWQGIVEELVDAGAIDPALIERHTERNVPGSWRFAVRAQDATRALEKWVESDTEEVSAA